MVQTVPRSEVKIGRAYRFPRWPRGPKPKRRTELGLLVFGALITTALYIIAELGFRSHIPPHIGPFLGIVLGLSLVAHLANRWLAPMANPVVLPIAALLNGVGYVVIARWNPPFAKAQAGWAAIGVVLYVLTLLVVQHSRDLDRYRYLLLLIAGLLLISPFIPGLGVPAVESGGARLFVHIGSEQFQPIEFSKILLVVFFASYFAENKELLAIPTARLGNRLVLDPRPLIPILIAWGLAMVVIGLENDIGFAMLLFTMFIALLWITTGRIGYLIFGVLLFAGGALAAAHLFPQVHERVSLWLNPWNSVTLGAGQLKQAWYALAAGGVGGTGLGRDVYAGTIPELTSDMIFAAIGDEMGLLGSSVVVIGFLLLVGAGLHIAQKARSDFARLVATGLTVILGFQAFFIMAGVLRLLPLTGITLPFMAYGGSSLIANYILIALLLRLSDEGNAAAAEQPSGMAIPGDAPFVVASR